MELEQETKEVQEDEIKIVKTDTDTLDGQNKCPKCGSTDISLDISNSKLRCNYCRYEFDAKKLEGMEEDISHLSGMIIGSGVQDIADNDKNIMTLKCTSCGAEVVIDTNEATQARCHWCRNTLSINQQIPNGAIPDMVLPFKIKKEEAQAEIDKFIKKRKFYANTTFKREFNSSNVMGVYLPYMLIDVNSHAKFAGQAEIETRRYNVGSRDDKEIRYDADVYDVEREFDMIVEDLTVESNTEKLDFKNKDKTNNIINSIMPFDTENCVKWDANFLRGFTSQKRDANIDNLENRVKDQIEDIARYNCNSTIRQYDRGAKWTTQEVDIKGEQWNSAYLPVWLYSYKQKVNNKESILHYVAVNARTKETMGSVPLNKLKLFLVSAFIEIIGFILFILTSMSASTSSDNDSENMGFMFLMAGFVYYGILYAKYRNNRARHFHEKETKSNISNVAKKDSFVKKLKGLKSCQIDGANNRFVNGGLNISTGRYKF